MRRVILYDPFYFPVLIWMAKSNITKRQLRWRNELMRGLTIIFSHPMNEYPAEYSNQGRHYEASSNSDLRVFGDPLSVAENAVNTSAMGRQSGSLDKLQAWRQTCGDNGCQTVGSNPDIAIKCVPH